MPLYEYRCRSYKNKHSKTELPSKKVNKEKKEPKTDNKVGKNKNAHIK